MKGILWLYFCGCVYSLRNIISRQIHTKYDDKGEISALVVQFKPEAIVYAHDYLRLEFIQPITSNTSNTTTLSISTANEHQLTTSRSSVGFEDIATYYWVVGTDLQPATWYKLQVDIHIDLMYTWAPLSLSFTSAAMAQAIMYNWNDGFEYYHIQQNTPTSTILVQLANSLSLKPGATYETQISVESTQSINQTVWLTLTIEHPNLTDHGFTLMGTCYAVCGVENYTCIHSHFCSVHGVSIQVQLPYMLLNQSYLLRMYVVNPVHVSEAGIKAYWQDRSGQTMAVTYLDNVFEVQSISIIGEEINLLWGIPYDRVVDEMGLGLFVNQVDSALQMSSFDIGFSISETTPIQSTSMVKVWVGASSVMGGSINHNLPAFGGNKIICEYILPWVRCSGVGSLTEVGKRYYVRGSGYFMEDDDLTFFGDVDIQIEGSAFTLFDRLYRSFNITTIVSADYHDYTGLHDGSKRVGETMVFSHADTLLPNSTTESVEDLMYGNGFVGIDASVSPSQLLFTLKTSQQHIALTNFTTNYTNSTHNTNNTNSSTYTIRLFYNTNVMNGSQLGIDFVAYNSNTSKWDVQSTDCYVDYSLTPTTQMYACQKYDDHVASVQIDNQRIINNGYGMYEWVCGDGSYVSCMNGSCVDDCWILKGGFDDVIGDGEAGLLSIRDVVFRSGYHSPLEANTLNLDFIIAFYHNDMLVSASLINAYTIQPTRLSSVTASLINHYHDNVTFNSGRRIPTLISIEGTLTIDEAGSIPFEHIRVHFPSTLSTDSFTESSLTIGCTTSCTCQKGGISASVDNWLQQSSVIVSQLPSLTDNFRIMFPVTWISYFPVDSFTICFLDANYTVQSIYRLGGSSVSEMISSSLSFIAQPSMPVDLWDDSLTSWVFDSSLYAFEQSIDLAGIERMVPTININLGTTTMPINETSPSTTFTSAYTNIFSSFSTAASGSQDCVPPFRYTFEELYDVWVLWCPVGASSISIEYPSFSSVLSEGFPFQMVFAYSYAGTSGQLLGYREEDGNKSSAATCTTTKTTQYRLNRDGPQENTFVITFSPITINSKGTIMVTITIPSTIPVIIISCESIATITEGSLSLPCTVESSTTSTFQLQLSNTQSNMIMVMGVDIKIKTIKQSAPTTSTIQPYQIEVILPYSTGGEASWTGTEYSPYSSTLYVCDNSFTYSSVASTEYIELSNGVLSGYSAEYWSAISFQCQFSQVSSKFMSTSSLIITFTDDILEAESMCRMQPDYHYWAGYVVNSTAFVLYPHATILQFTDTPFTISCERIVTHGNDFDIEVFWQDSGYFLQSTYTPISITHTLNTAITVGTGSLLGKKYASVGYKAEYMLQFACPSGGDKLRLVVSFPTHHIHPNLLECKYMSDTWQGVACWVDKVQSGEQVVMQFIPDNNTVQVCIYGVDQPLLATAIKAIAMNIDTQNSIILSHTLFQVIDSVPSIVLQSPIEIHQFEYTQPTLTMRYSLPAFTDGTLYFQVDQLFKLHQSAVLTCIIDDVAYDCERMAPDLIKIDNAPHDNSTNMSEYTMVVSSLYPNSLELDDPSYIHCKLFILDTTNQTILHGSHTYMQNPVLTSIITTLSLVWEMQISFPYHTIYVGYYGAPILLHSSSSQPFQQEFSLTFPDTSSFTFQSTSVQLGSDEYALNVACTNDSLVTSVHYWWASHDSSAYTSVQPLNVYVSGEKCHLVTEFDEYSIFAGGTTIPIKVDISTCRPMATLTLTYSTDSSQLQIDDSLSTYSVQPHSTYFYVVLKHSSDTSTIGNTYHLTITITSENQLVQSAYFPIPNTMINVIDAGTLVGNAEGKQPVINQLTYNSASLTLQCNEPSTLYWGIGVYPSMLGITAEQIQARLVSAENGFQQHVVDIYSWSQQQYGLMYSEGYDIEQELVIVGLVSGYKYVFKYFCVDQGGRPSGGKLSYLEVAASEYGLIKIIASYEQRLTYTQNNLLACAISQALTIPYYQTITSTNTNCKNNSNIFHNNSTLVHDSMSDGLYQYNFYVDSQKISTNTIKNILHSQITKNQRILNISIPAYYSLYMYIWLIAQINSKLSV